MVEYLIDRAVKSKNIKNKEGHNKMVSELKIEDNKIYYQYLDENFWSELISLDHLLDKNVNEIIDSFDDEYFIPESIKTKIKQIKQDLDFAWDSDSCKFKLDYNLNDLGQIHELYIPTGKNYLDKIIIAEIYDDSGNFVAHEIENKIDIPLYKIESMNLYTNKISNENQLIYSKEKVSFREKLNNKKLPPEFTLPWFGFSAFITLIPFMIYTHTNSVFISLFSAAVLTVISGLYLVCLYLTISIPFIICKIMYNYYINGKNHTYKYILER